MLLNFIYFKNTYIFLICEFSKIRANIYFHLVNLNKFSKNEIFYFHYNYIIIFYIREYKKKHKLDLTFNKIFKIFKS